MHDHFSIERAPRPILKIAEIMPGDVILGRADYVGADITDATGSKYTHAAICVDPGWVAEASGSRVKKTEIKSLVDQYDYLAVLRQQTGWQENQIVRLRNFVEAAIARKARFNTVGIRNFEQNKEIHEENVMEKLHEFFQSGAGPAIDRESYFCSELVSAAHVAAGIVSSSMAVAYDPGVLSPADLTENFTFGVFYGYLVPYAGFKIPLDDEFKDAPLHSEVQPEPGGA